MIAVRTINVIAGSPLGPINSDTLEGGVGYGGIDEEGTKDPSARRFSVWDDDEEEED